MTKALTTEEIWRQWRDVNNLEEKIQLYLERGPWWRLIVKVTIGSYGKTENMSRKNSDREWKRSEIRGYLEKLQLQSPLRFQKESFIEHVLLPRRKCSGVKDIRFRVTDPQCEFLIYHLLYNIRHITFLLIKLHLQHIDFIGVMVPKSY